MKVPAAVGTPPVAAATEEENPAHTVRRSRAEPRSAGGTPASPRCVLFALSMGAISLVEAFTDKPLSATVRNTSATGTTLFGGSKDGADKKKNPAPATSADPAPDEDASTPDPAASEPAPADPATDPPTTTEPAPTTVAPTTQAPVVPEQPADPAQGEQGQGTLPE